MKIIYASFLLFFIASPLFGQNVITHLPMFNEDFFNPAHIGVENDKTLFYGFRNPVPINDNIFSSFGGYGQNIDRLNSGIGASYYFNRNGLGNTHQFGITYNYRIKISGSSNLRIGLQPILMKQTINFDDFIFIQPEPGFPTGRQTKIRPDLDAGLLFQEQYFQIGFSTKYLFESTFDYSGRTFLTNERRFHLHAKFEVPLGDNLTTVPSFFWIKESNIRSLWVSQHFEFKNTLFFGASHQRLARRNNWHLYGGLKLFDRISLIFQIRLNDELYGRSYEGMAKYEFKNGKKQAK